MKRIFILLIIGITSLTLFSQSKQLNIGSFNIQNFGKSKLAKKEIVDTLASIVRQFDLIAIQELSDVSNTVAPAFVSIINNNKYHYKLACSKRTGMQPDNKSSQEQYAFIYNSDVLILLDTSLYDDSAFDYFHREPFIASFKTKSGKFSFIIATIHTNPEHTLSEISSLANVADWIPTRFKSCSNLIFCGDFNASCSYANPSQLASIPFHQKPYNWIIPDSAKTNLSPKNTCAYDRFVIVDALMPNLVGWKVLHSFKSKSISDHWPVSLTLKYK